VRLRVTQSELGSMLGVSRESVNKQLNRFARQGWIALGRGSVTLNDIEALHDEAARSIG
jgi:CRP-like cAMP-binding protein